MVLIALLIALSVERLYHSPAFFALVVFSGTLATLECGTAYKRKVGK